eukprot:CAMPEP_0198714934 /NCGR_PEP_ID=MMETSP1471-20131121/25786_1 /TAXON_ID=41880 /ORGANISM="Pycnococcus provasolii, Strain RCC733" /LENGTH=80 /DNA_ID=CAMNT_0044475293 /DNA_START=170 /DNA_END=412 /DNA_ORIENTATION=-
MRVQLGDDGGCVSDVQVCDGCGGFFDRASECAHIGEKLSLFFPQRGVHFTQPFVRWQREVTLRRVTIMGHGTTTTDDAPS